MASVMVLCAGLGSRLGALSSELSKPLLPVGDRPLLAHILDTVAAQGFDRAVVNVHHQPAAFRAFRTTAIELELSFEAELLGTAGGVRHALPSLTPPVVVWNGDIATVPPLCALLRQAEQHDFCLLAKPVERGAPSTLGLDENGRVVRLRGEVFGREVRAANYVGVCALSGALLASLPESGCLIGDVGLPRLRRDEPLATLTLDGDWTDMGTPQKYLELNLRWLDEQRLLAYVAPDVEVPATVRLEKSLLHQGARLAGQGDVIRSIVLPGAVARVPLNDCIVTPSGVVLPAANGHARH